MSEALGLHPNTATALPDISRVTTRKNSRLGVRITAASLLSSIGLVAGVGFEHSLNDRAEDGLTKLDSCQAVHPTLLMDQTLTTCLNGTAIETKLAQVGDYTVDMGASYASAREQTEIDARFDKSDAALYGGVMGLTLTGLYLIASVTREYQAQPTPLAQTETTSA